MGCGCNFCKDRRRMFDRNSFGYIDSDGKNGPMLVVDHHNFVSIFDINFCPMCGADLRKENSDGESGT